ncbi:hypothetical protein DFH11DRAFT_427971 [Phellopilus nigrolimitatus]|nr:hypothetical protein DFH11DRAFT_427971 [Phellopilus nigrolimitatus]
MLAGLPSFYFPLRDSDDYEFPQSFLVTADGRRYSLNAMVMFFVLQILGGHVGVPSVLVTLFYAKGLRRHPMLINFLVTWVIYSTSFCVLLYLGKQFGPEPTYGLCVFQASAIYGTAVMTATAGLSFVLNLWLTLRAMSNNKSVVDQSNWRNIALIASPYVTFAIFVIFAAIFGSTNPSLVTRNRYLFYCTINSKAMDIIPAVSAMIMFTIILFEALIAFKLYHMHKAFVHMRSNGGPPMHLVVRVGVFSVYSFLAIIACIGFWSRAGAELPYIIQASLPTAAFLIFGTQKDLLEVWGVIRIWHWIRRKPRPVRVIKESKLAPVLDSGVA